jgi:hypothetical protein
MTKENIDSAPAGWYPDPEGNLRYWDGTTWLNIPLPPGNDGTAENEKSSKSNRKEDTTQDKQSLILGEDFNLGLGTSIFVGEYQNLFKWPLTDSAVIDFCEMIIEDSNIRNQIGLVDTDSTSWGNPRLDPTHLNSYLWALGGVLFADYFDVSDIFTSSKESSSLDWNQFRQSFREIQREGFSSPSYIDFDKAPVDFYINSISSSNQEITLGGDCFLVLVEELSKCTSSNGVENFLSFFQEEVDQKELLDESVIKFLSTEIVISLPGITEFSLESVIETISAIKLGDEQFDWEEPSELPWLIEHNREISKKITYNPWPCHSDSRGLWNDDPGPQYAIDRLEKTLPEKSMPTMEQMVATLSSLNLISDEISTEIPANLNTFIEDNQTTINDCSDAMEDQWAINEEYSLPMKSEFKVSGTNKLAKEVKKIWGEYTSIIRE